MKEGGNNQAPEEVLGYKGVGVGAREMAPSLMEGSGKRAPLLSALVTVLVPTRTTRLSSHPVQVTRNWHCKQDSPVADQSALTKVCSALLPCCPEGLSQSRQAGAAKSLLAVR